ncbi:MAG: tRNA (adenosine(37)-N6)-threonylcarbamoyltransferase complex dimerization subunit type 1 TsaB [Tannerella sp.]|jgi:tRNA threonylcarbamoyladenosine biosynthesis protein TsaB|nr:tRNA (adenosine(37)-N6)-threonylcarbamoyltransferase complex dimerization subunit type 1 TsaB [Tannerella sp.]
MTLLNIETSAKICSVAVTAGEKILFEKVSEEAMTHAKMTGVFVEEALKFAHEQHKTIDAVAVSAGPGSYTGLRIGVSTAKGVCFGLNIPLLAIPTLFIYAAKAAKVAKVDKTTTQVDFYCPMLDARRMEVYAAVFDTNLNEVKETHAEILTEESYKEYSVKGRVAFFGNGADKASTVIKHENTLFLQGVEITAADMATPAAEAFAAQRFENTAYFEPFYLKEFIATTPKNKVFCVN